jgi:hypothetical protein
MPITRRNFLKGIMDQDTDERLLPDGVYREAENVLIVNSEGSDVGSIENSLSNKQLTNLDLGENPKCLLGFNDGFEDKLYWFIKSDSGCFLLEWDNKNEVVSIVLKDTRTEDVDRVLNLKEDKLITGIHKIINEDPKKNLFLWTDDNIQPCCVNIERAKAYGENGFDKEDIYLIKKPPRYAPTIIPITLNDQSNNMEDRFFTFSYRFKYLDGEYSALSDYTNYVFTPKEFQLDYLTLDNLGMVNNFNAVKLFFETGDKRVTDIQLVVKNSNSNNLYVIQNFNKSKEGWLDNVQKSYIFSNNKTYAVLPGKELYRAFDNVPLKAKAMTFIGNRPIFGNYLEGYNLIDHSGKKINIDFSVSLINENISTSFDFEAIVVSLNTLELDNTENYELTTGSTINLNLNILLDSTNDVYSNSFSLILENDYASLVDFGNSEEFQTFFEIIRSDYVINYNSNSAYDVPDGWVVTIETDLTYSIVGDKIVISVTDVTFEDTLDANTEHIIAASFSEQSSFDINYSSNSSSCKTNRDYEVGIIYEDEFNRRTTVLTCPYNTIYIPQKYSIFKNRIKVNINNKPPYWADRYKLVFKASPLQYDTIYINEFYNEDFYVWCRLISDNKDKIKIGDDLIVKRAGNQLINEPIKIKVLDIAERDKDFIIDNKDSKGLDIIEPKGVYMQINPNGFSMDYEDFKVFKDSKNGKASRGNYPTVFLDLFSEETSPDVYEDFALPQGSSVIIDLNSSFKYDVGWRNLDYKKEYFCKRDYANLEEFYNEIILNKNLYATDNLFNEVKNYKDNVELIRGFPVLLSIGVGVQDRIINITPDPLGKLYLKVKGLESGGSGGRYGRVYAKITVRTSIGVYVFETIPNNSSNNTYYETAQTFDIVDGQHTGNLQNQELDSFLPAIVDSDFFNCYTQGNGVESYKIKDGFNKNYLNIDLRPSATSVEEYAEIRRFADLTYGEPYNESSNINGLNEFNLSTANFKQIDKIYGSIQKLHSRDNDILVLQEEKASKVLFGKDALYNADGNSNLTSLPEVLGSQVTYLGENGISTNPESFAINDYQIFYTNARRGLVHRLSIDGVTPIVNFMGDFFRDLFRQQPKSKKVAAFDPYHNQYILSVDDEPATILSLGCDNTIFKKNITTSFTYNLTINDLEGDIVLNYDISLGNATITALFDGDIFVESNVTGLGTITIPRDNLSENIVVITITPVTEIVDFEISNVCPTGIPMKVIEIVLSDSLDLNKTITNRYRWGNSNLFTENDVLSEGPISRFTEKIGIEGVGSFPKDGSVVRIDSFKSNSDTGRLNIPEQCNRLGYLITSSVYTNLDIETILDQATFLEVTSQTISLNSFLEYGSFLFDRAVGDENLYLIWDYTNRKPIAVDDYTSTPKGTSKNIEVLSNDTDPLSLPLTITIISGPTNGLAIIEADNTITYTHNDTDTYTDVIVYEISNGICSTQATIYIDIAVACDGSFSYTGAVGIFNLPISYGTEIGTCGISYEAFSIADKFEIYWDGNLVATTGTEVSGSGTITFEKTAATPTQATIVVTATTSDTNWEITGICPIP